MIDSCIATCYIEFVAEVMSIEKLTYLIEKFQDEEAAKKQCLN